MKKYFFFVAVLLLSLPFHSCDRAGDTPSSVTSDSQNKAASGFTIEVPSVRIYDANGTLIKETILDKQTLTKPESQKSKGSVKAVNVVGAYTYATPEFGSNFQIYPNTYLSIVAKNNNTIITFANNPPFTLQAGQLWTTVNSFYGGTIVSSNYPIQAYVEYVTTAGWSRGFTLPPYNKCGVHYRMPWISGVYSNNYVTVSAFEYTTVWIGGTPHNISPNYPRLLQLNPQTLITSDKPIAVYAWANEPNIVRSATVQALDN